MKCYSVWIRCYEDCESRVCKVLQYDTEEKQCWRGRTICDVEASRLAGRQGLVPAPVLCVFDTFSTRRVVARLRYLNFALYCYVDASLAHGGLTSTVLLIAPLYT